MYAGILFHEFPFYSLLKGTPQNLMNRTDCTGGNKLVLPLPTHRVSSLIFEQPLIIPLDHAGGDILQLHRADERSYVIGNQCSVCLIGWKCPFAFSIEGNIFRKQVVKGFALRNYKGSNWFLVFDLFLAIFGIRKIGEGFPLLLGGAICILIGICNSGLLAQPTLLSQTA